MSLKSDVRILLLGDRKFPIIDIVYIQFHHYESRLYELLQKPNIHNFITMKADYELLQKPNIQWQWLVPGHFAPIPVRPDLLIVL